MKKVHKSFIFLLLFLASILYLVGYVSKMEAAAPKNDTTEISPKIIGYYPAWAKYLNYGPDKIDATKLTHINYAFANISENLTITLGYPHVDESNIKELLLLKEKNPKLKLLISVGGWSWSGKFSKAARTEASRTKFADSCVEFLIKYGFDGLDIDWEYPVSGGLEEENASPKDKQNFTLLMKKLREKLDTKGAKTGKKYLLSFAGGSGTWYVDNVELSKLHKYVDYASVMSYDIHGPWERYTNFNAPLYNNTDTPKTQNTWSVNSSIGVWINAGFPKEKLVMGIPFYGYHYVVSKKANHGLYQLYKSSAAISYQTVYKDYLNKPDYTKYFHTSSKVPWLYNGSDFITYEDTQSVTAKTNFMKENELGGIMIWELSQDYNQMLLNTIYKNLQ